MRDRERLYTLIGDPYYEESLAARSAKVGKEEKLKSLRVVKSFAT